MATANSNNPLTKAEFEAGMQALRDYIDERIKRVVASQHIAQGFRFSDEIKGSRDINPHGYAEADMDRLAKEVRAETAAELAKQQNHS